MSPVPLSRILLGTSLVLTLVLALGLSPVAAEMLQFSAPDGSVKSWPKLPDIGEWHQDQELSTRLGVNYLVPDGADPATSDVSIQARGYSRNTGGVSSLSQLMDQDRNAAPPGAQLTKRADVPDKDGTPFTLVSFAPAQAGAGDWKAVAYSEEGEYLLAFTLDAHSQAGYDKNLPVFTGLIRRYARDIPW
jgi:hypothetical protein